MRTAMPVVLFLAAWPGLVAGTTLYKSVDGNGVVMFSDVPPPASSRILEERQVTPSSGATVVISNGSPSYAAESALPEPRLDSDAILAAANARLDEAERSLATARRSAGPTVGAVRLAASRLSRDDEQRIENEKRNVKMARARLLELMRERRALENRGQTTVAARQFTPRG